MTEYIYQRLFDDDLKEIVRSGPSKIHGTGLFSTRTIEKGEYIGTFHGPEVKKDGDHVLWVETEENSKKMLGIRGENLLRFLNHDDKPNSEFFGLDLYACRAIRKNSEITLDYGS